MKVACPSPRRPRSCFGLLILMILTFAAAVCFKTADAHLCLNLAGGAINNGEFFSFEPRARSYPERAFHSGSSPHFGRRGGAGEGVCEEVEPCDFGCGVPISRHSAWGSKTTISLSWQECSSARSPSRGSSDGYLGAGSEQEGSRWAPYGVSSTYFSGWC